jgi:hypothetical protein
VIIVANEPVTVHSNPPIVTWLLLMTVLNPVPVIKTVVDIDDDPEMKIAFINKEHLVEIIKYVIILSKLSNVHKTKLNVIYQVLFLYMQPLQ